MTSKRIWLSVVIGTTIIIGGLLMIRNPFTGEEEPRYKSEQDRVVQYISNRIELVSGESLKKVEFIEFQYEKIPGSWWITVKINNKYLLSLSEGELGGEIRTSRFSPSEIRQLDKANNQLKDIEIIYYEEKISDN